jgi:hypothetical protein
MHREVTQLLISLGVMGEPSPPITPSNYYRLRNS